MIYISTGGEKKLSAYDLVKIYHKHNINHIELSGTRYSSTLFRDLKTLKSKINFQIHNYFPPPKIPFVINLASLDSNINRLSFEHAKNSIDWCKELGATHYSFHAGFLIDPGVNELGGTIMEKKLYKKDYCLEAFVKNVLNLNKYARDNNITLMIENNVITTNTLSRFGSNPLLMCDPKEIEMVMNYLTDDIKLLTDVAHLKVSSNTLKFDPSLFFELCNHKIGGYHLSDNDGLSDSNDTFNENSWFWKYLNLDLSYFSIEVYSSDIDILLNQREIFNKFKKNEY